MARESKAKRNAKRFGVSERIADQIHDSAWIIPSFGRSDHSSLVDYKQEIERIVASAHKSKHFDVQNVYEFCLSSMQGKLVTFENEFPTFRLPFPEIFLEWKSFPRGERTACLKGCLFSYADLSDCPDGCINNETVSVIRADTISKDAKSGDLEFHASVFCPIRNDGSLCNGVSYRIKFGRSMPEGLKAETMKWINSIFAIASMAINFLHCKNVSSSEIDPNISVGRERRKAGLKPFLRYHTININPMKEVLRTEGNIEANGLNKALHICRGHFATYTDEKPLFGRFTGTIWKPSHVRGSAKQGVVVSDYKVNAPRAAL
ncbi:hypothetical protein V5E97_06620 [Singulisphaera sp. Ch08]|uniref:Uncharacterized protein n=1 Tax=Singulisphaera sp. Ch08 TaxID=3120278 RepID=A0AAU7CKE1_9BACT